MGQRRRDAGVKTPSTSPNDCPVRLQPGDVIEAYFKPHWLNWIVRSVTNLTDCSWPEQEVIASRKGQGSVRFKWVGGMARRYGAGHGKEFYFVSRAAVQPDDVWRHANGREYRILFITNTSHSNANHPCDVVYESLPYRDHKWSRPLSDWFRSFTLVSRQGEPQ